MKPVVRQILIFFVIALVASCAQVTMDATRKIGGDGSVVYGVTPILVALSPGYKDQLREAVYKLDKPVSEFPGGYLQREFKPDGELKAERGLSAADITQVEIGGIPTAMIAGSFLPFQSPIPPIIQNGALVSHLCYGPSMGGAMANSKLNVMVYLAPGPNSRFFINFKLVRPNGFTHSIVDEPVTMLDDNHVAWSSFNFVMNGPVPPYNGVPANTCRFVGMIPGAAFSPPVGGNIDFNLNPTDAVLRKYIP